MAFSTDNFNRANSGTLGANWTLNYKSTVTQFTISTNTAVPSTFSADDCWVSWNNVSFGQNQYSKCKVTVSGGASGSGLGPSVRNSGLNDNVSTFTQQGYRLVMAGDHSSCSLQAQSAGGTNFEEILAFTQSWSDGDTWELDVTGTGAATAFTIKLNGTTVKTATALTLFLTGGQPGITCSTTITSGLMDDWEGGDLISDQLDWMSPSASAVPVFPSWIQACLKVRWNRRRSGILVPSYGI